jgi:serine/threonine protein kinase
VAVKVIRAELAADHEFRTRFGREVAAARKVNGLFTALVVDADTESDVPWLATAYIAGPSLAEAVARNGPLPAVSVLALAAGLAESIGAIHAAGVVHRDLKPANVLLADDGPRVIDFGISRAAEATSLTGTGFVVGSPGFMSPEQAEGREVGPPSDIFSLGSVLVFAAAGRGPFGAGSTAALVYRIVHTSPELDRLPAELRPLVGRCLAKDPGDRPAAADVLAGVGAVQPAPGWLPEPVSCGPGGDPPGHPPTATSHRPPPPAALPPEPSPPAGRKRTRLRPLAVGWAAGGLVAAAAAAILVVLTALPHQPSHAAPAAAVTHSISVTPSASATSSAPVTPSASPTPSVSVTPTASAPPSASAAPPPGNNQTLSVEATTGWQFTDIYLTAGERFTVSYVYGGWTVDYRNFPYVGPGGYTSQEDARIYQLCKFDSNATYGVLFGVVGLTGQAFPVGTGASFTAGAPSPDVNGGYLYLRINDKCFSDNAGSVTVQITTS